MTRASSSLRHLFGLAPSGVCLAIDVTINAVVSYTAFSPLPLVQTAVLFCGTFPRVAPGGRYPPLCSTESGLSSASQHQVFRKRGDPDDSSVWRGYAIDEFFRTPLVWT